MYSFYISIDECSLDILKIDSCFDLFLKYSQKVVCVCVSVRESGVSGDTQYINLYYKSNK